MNRQCRHCGDMVRRKTCPICKKAVGDICFGCHLEKKHGLILRKDVPQEWLERILKRKKPVRIYGKGRYAMIRSTVFKNFTRPERSPSRLTGLNNVRKELRYLLIQSCK